jgi:hypothetical protein
VLFATSEPLLNYLMRSLRNCSKLSVMRTITLLLFVIPILYFLDTLIIYRGHDWDIDSFLYLGSRLNQGELLYFRDFETKLPFLQYLFWLPYKLGGIGSWRLITFALSLSLALVSSHLIVGSLIEQRDNGDLLSSTITPLSASVFLTFLYSLPGSSSAQIEMFAASFIYLAIAAAHRALTNKRSANIYIGLSGFATAIAISIRPNYLFTMPAFILFIFLANRSGREGKYAYAIRQTALFTLITSLMTISQFIPYLLNKSGLSVLVDASRALLFQFSSGSASEIFNDQFFTKEVVAFYSFMYLSIAIMFLTALFERRSNSRTPIFFSGTLFCLVSIICLNYSFGQTHYWPHNTIMYVPYAALIFLYIYVLTLTKRTSFIKHRVIQTMIIGILCAWYISIIGTHFVWEVRGTLSKPLSLAINDREIDHRMLGFLRRLTSVGMSFYVPENANYHRLLNQDRIGDGHPLNLLLILRGQRIGPIGSIFLYSDTVNKSPCLALWESHKDVIIVEARDQEVLLCLLPDVSGYKEVLSDENKTYRIFAREQSLRLNQVVGLLHEY